MRQSYFKIEINGLTHQRFDYEFGNGIDEILKGGEAWNIAENLKRQQPQSIITFRHIVNVETEIYID